MAGGIDSAKPTWTRPHVEEGRRQPPELGESERELARQRAAHEAEARRRQEEADSERQRRRRELIQQAKASTGLAWRLRRGFTLTPEVEARVMQGIERELAVAPVDEWPWSEVQTVAEGVWARVCVPAEAEQAEATRRADEAVRLQRQTREAAALKAQEEQARMLAHWRREAEERTQRTVQKQKLTAHAQVYLAKALIEVGDVSPLERLELTWKVERALATDVASAGTTEDVEDLVDDVLEREGGIVVEEDEADEGWDDDEDENDDEAYENDEED